MLILNCTAVFPWKALKSISSLFFLFLFVGSPFLLRGQTCNCEEKLYVNDLNEQSVHKFTIETGGSLTEIGSPWLQGNLIAPHGLGIDVNGNIYVGEVVNYTGGGVQGDISKINCNGEILNGDFINLENDNFGYQIFSTGEFIYTINGQTDEVQMYNICDGSYVGSLSTGWASGSYAWGTYLDEAENKWYAPDRITGLVYCGTLDPTQYTNPATATGTVAFDTGFPSSPTSNAFVNGAMGITRDAAGNFYIIFNSVVGEDTAIIRKFDSAGNLLSTIMDSSGTPNGSDGLSGFWGARGIVYSEDQNLLYVGNYDNCVSVFNTDLVEQVSSNIGNPTAGFSKGIGIAKECCPINSTMVIDTVVCDANVNDLFYLNEFINCEGNMCEGIWTPAAGNSGLTYDVCDDSFTLSSVDACGSFTYASDGTAPNSQCGAFSITINIVAMEKPSAVLSSDETLCSGNVATTASLTTDADNIEWQMSTTSCTAGFITIAGATASIYEPGTLTQTTYYRTIASNAGTCNSGNCVTLSNCISYIVTPNPTLSISATQVTCFNGSDGTATVMASGGLAPYAYLWSNGQTTATATNLLAGNYLVTVTDINSCQEVSSINVTSISNALPCLGIGISRN